MVKPKVGMIVLYYPGSREVIPKTVGKPLAAIVSAVHHASSVNLNVVGFDGSSHARCSVEVVPSGLSREVGEFYGYCVLPPDTSDHSDLATIGVAESAVSESAVARAALMFFTETVRQLIGQLNPSQNPMDAAREAWAVTRYVRECLEELK